MSHFLGDCLQVWVKLPLMDTFESTQYYSQAIKLKPLMILSDIMVRNWGDNLIVCEG